VLSANAVLDVARAFSDRKVRYLFVGGLAVIAHGYVRMTSDLDIVLDLAPDNLRAALRELDRLGFRPRVPVPIEQFADAERRREWIETKDMVVFAVWRDSASGPVTIDLFVVEPFPFREAYQDAFWQTHASGVRFPFVDLKRLLEMKIAAGRPKDLLDVAELRRINQA
jgi:hypothetical protein